MRTLRTLPSARQVRANRAPARPDNQVCPAVQGLRHATPAEAAALQASTQASAVSVAESVCAAVAQTTWTSVPLSAHATEWACQGCSKRYECLSGRLGPKGPLKGQKKSEAAAPRGLRQWFYQNRRVLRQARTKTSLPAAPGWHHKLVLGVASSKALLRIAHCNAAQDSPANEGPAIRAVKNDNGPAPGGWQESDGRHA